MKTGTFLCSVLAGLLLAGGRAQADARSRAATSAAEAVMARFGAKAGGSAASLAARIEACAARHGKGAIAAVRRVGPDALGLIDRAGVNGAKAARVLAVHGEAGATWVLRRPAAMRLLERHGEAAAAALVRHPGVAEAVVERGGAAGVRAMSAVNGQNGRRIAMLLEGDLARQSAKHPELLEVIARTGNRGAAWVWENKGALAVGSALIAFVSHPEPFINGTRDITRVAAESVAAPIARGMADSVNWTLVVLAGLGCLAGFLIIRLGLLRQALPGKGGSHESPA